MSSELPNVTIVDMTGTKSELYTDAGLELTDEQWHNRIIVECDFIARSALTARLHLLEHGMRSIHPLCVELDRLAGRWAATAEAQRREWHRLLRKDIPDES